jgi:hypothetical protein
MGERMGRLASLEGKRASGVLLYDGILWVLKVDPIDHYGVPL